jgi:hypothetical protein
MTSSAQEVWPDERARTSAPSHAILPAAWNVSMGPLSSRSPFCRQFLRKTTTSDPTLIFSDGYRHVAVCSVQARSAIACASAWRQRAAKLAVAARPGCLGAGYDAAIARMRHASLA